MQYSVNLRNNQLAQIEATIGQSPILRMYTGTKPLNCTATATGTLVAEMTLPVDWMSAPANGAVEKSGTWQDTSADADGTLGYFRIYDSAISNCHIQGSITLTGGGGDMTVVNNNVMTGQPIIVTAFSIGAGNE